MRENSERIGGESKENWGGRGGTKEKLRENCGGIAGGLGERMGI